MDISSEKCGFYSLVDWEKIALPVNIKASCMWHTTAMYHLTPFEALVLTMGGFENTNRREKPLGRCYPSFRSEAALQEVS